MAELDKVLLNLVSPIVDDQSCLRIEQKLSVNGKDVVLYIYATSEDIARLIGRKGIMASALRQMMSVASHTENRRVSIQFNEISK